MTQANVQDIMWLDDAAAEIRQVKFLAYFVSLESVAPADAKQFYVVMPLSSEFRERYNAAWRRLTKVESFRLHLFHVASDELPGGDWYVKTTTHSTYTHRPMLTVI